MVRMEKLWKDSREKAEGISEPNHAAQNQEDPPEQTTDL
jgi:hypothetical protein